MLWHTGREIDVQLSAMTGDPERWADHRDALGLGELGDSLGYGHSREDAAAIRVEDQGLLAAYVRDTLAATRAYLATLSEADLDDVVDDRWDPPVTRGVRLISVIDDAIQHLAQAAYAAGALTD